MICYAAPSGAGDGSSLATPTTIANAWNIVKSGWKLVLLDGTYTESLASPTGITNVKVEALNDGAVTIDGENTRVPVTLSQAGWTLSGINACRSSGNVFTIIGDNITVTRCIGWDAKDDSNSHIFGVSSGTGITLEDCAGFGVARKTFSVSSGATYVTLRRCFGIWEGFTGTNGPTMTYTLGYKTYHVTIDQCIGMRNRWRVEGVPDQPFAIFGTDNYWEVSADTYNVLTNSLGLVRASDVYDPARVILCTNMDEYTIENCVMIALQSMTQTSSIVGDTAEGNSLCKDTSLFGPLPNSWGYFEKVNVIEAETMAAVYGEGEGVWNTVQGAQLDADVFLNWPMRQRIIGAMIAAGYEGANVIDVHAELIAVFGEP